MAKEISVSYSIQLAKGFINLALTSGLQNLDMAGSAAIQNLQSVQNAVEPVLLGDVSAPKIIVLVNQDPVKTVDVFLDAGGTQKAATLPAAPVVDQGIPMPILCAAGVTYYMKASASSANVLVIAG